MNLLGKLVASFCTAPLGGALTYLFLVLFTGNTAVEIAVRMGGLAAGFAVIFLAALRSASPTRAWGLGLMICGGIFLLSVLARLMQM